MNDVKRTDSPGAVSAERASELESDPAQVRLPTGESVPRTRRIDFSAGAAAKASFTSQAPDDSGKSLDTDDGPTTHSLFSTNDHVPIQREPHGDEEIREVRQLAPPERAAAAKLIEAAEAKPMERDADLSVMTISELQKQKDLVEAKILERQTAQKLKVIDQIVRLAQTNDIAVEQIVGALGGLSVKRRLGPALQRYQDPETGSTWSGRGKEPAWIRGKDRARFKVE